MLNGMKPPSRIELPRIEDRISFLYAEQCRLEKDDGAVLIQTNNGTISVPAGQLIVLMLGPGTTVTHRMVQIAAEAGMQIVWCGEEGVRFYAGGSPLSGNTELLLKQAAIVSNQRLRLAAAKRMYGIRYPNEDFTTSTTRQLLGREGKRVTERYYQLAREFDIQWKGRSYTPDEYDKNDPLQNALSCANACLYGICYAVIYSLGLSPGLGIIHTGMAKSFVLDIADIYKENISFPVAFQVTAEGTYDLERRVRKTMRDIIKAKQLPQKIVKDIVIILNDPDITQHLDESDNYLWAGRQTIVKGGTLYGNDSTQP